MALRMCYRCEISKLIKLFSSTNWHSMCYIHINPFMFMLPSHSGSTKFTQYLSSSTEFPTVVYGWSDLMAQERRRNKSKLFLLCLYWFQCSPCFVVARSFRTSQCLSHQIKICCLVKCDILLSQLGKVVGMQVVEG